MSQSETTSLSMVNTALSGLKVIQARIHADHRGSFSRMFCATELAEVLLERTVRQSNVSVTRDVGTVRGLHYQRSTHAEMKLVRCVAGAVWDVAVDLRPSSSTFGQWHAETLSDQNGRALLIPEGFAHGFQTLEANSTLIYFHTQDYCPDAESGVSCDDPELAIPWPLPQRNLSARDASFPPFAQ